MRLMSDCYVIWKNQIKNIAEIMKHLFFIYYHLYLPFENFTADYLVVFLEIEEEKKTNLLSEFSKIPFNLRKKMK